VNLARSHVPKQPLHHEPSAITSPFHHPNIMTTMLPSTRANTTTIKSSITLTIISDFIGFD
jgi:hypothetical protein